jgi:hypothetical protein
MAVAAVSIYSCKKETVTKPEGGSTLGIELAQTPSNLRNINGSNTCLNFLTFDDYEKAISPDQQTTLSSILQSFTTYTSYSKSHPNDTLYGDKDFTDLLNSDGVVQIQGYYFKVDPEIQKVFVLPVTDAAYFNDLISDAPSSGKVTMFSTNDEVIAMIKDGAMFNTELAEVDITDSTTTTTFLRKVSLRKLFVKVVKTVDKWVNNNILNPISKTFAWNCGEVSAKKKSPRAQYGFNGNFADAYYKPLGIYFHLFGVIENTKKSYGYIFGFVGGIGNTSHADSGYVYYKPKCVSSSTQYSKISTGSNKIGTDGIPYVQYDSYKGTKPLNKIYFAFNVLYTDSGNYPVSRLIIIKQNM